jgi:hypothetical protein
VRAKGAREGVHEEGEHGSEREGELAAEGARVRASGKRRGEAIGKALGAELSNPFARSAYEFHLLQVAHVDAHVHEAATNLATRRVCHRTPMEQ